MTIRAVSYGGGIQSTALLVLAASGQIDYPLFLFANTGDDSENPATLAYIRQVALPYATEHGIELVQVARAGPTLLATLQDPGPSIPIPVQNEAGSPARRSCTKHWKINVIGRELKARGATATTPAIVAMGISVDEIERAGPTYDKRQPYRRIVYPLLDLKLSRTGCASLIARAGLPVPEKSACWFCPFNSLGTWRQLRQTKPQLFAQATQLEADLQQRRQAAGRTPIYLSGRGKPLADAIEDQLTLFSGSDSCDSGFCMT